jgi:osmotically-inducible protein OsmY
MKGIDTAQTVRDALAFDGRLNEANLIVRVGDGVVILEGVVLEERQRAEAEDVARAIPGVTNVINLIVCINQIKPCFDS